jgi:hypothetical protein
MKRAGHLSETMEAFNLKLNRSNQGHRAKELEG